MFLVLIEHTYDDGREWSVVTGLKSIFPTHKGLKSIFPTHKAAMAVAETMAAEYPNRFAVVQVRSWLQQEVQETKVVERKVV